MLSIPKTARRLSQILLGAFIVIPIGPTLALADEGKPVLIWKSENSPPLMIESGPNKGQGLTDLSLEVIKAYFPEYDHVLKSMPPLRFQEEIKKGTRICSPTTGMVFPDRTYSIPSAIVKHNFGIYFRPGTFGDVFPVGKDIDFDLLAKQEKIGAMEQWHPIAFPQLNHPRNRILPSAEQAAKMVFSKRADFLMTALDDLEYYKHAEKNTETFEFRLYAMEKGTTFRYGNYQVGYMHISCGTTPWAKDFITRVNDVLRKVRPTEHYRDIMMRWVPASIKEDALKAYKFFETSETPAGTRNF